MFNTGYVTKGLYVFIVSSTEFSENLVFGFSFFQVEAVSIHPVGLMSQDRLHIDDGNPTPDVFEELSCELLSTSVLCRKDGS